MHRRLPSLRVCSRALDGRYPCPSTLREPPFLPSLPLFIPLLAISISVYLFIFRSLATLAPRSTLPLSFCPRLHRAASLFHLSSSSVVALNPPLSLSLSLSHASALLPPVLSLLPPGRLLNHEATSVWRRDRACARDKKVFHEVSAGVSRDSQLWKRAVSLIGPPPAVRRTIDIAPVNPG